MRKRKTTDNPMQGLFNRKITHDHHQELLVTLRKKHSGKITTKLYIKEKKNVKREELESLFSSASDRFKSRPIYPTSKPQQGKLTQKSKPIRENGYGQTHTKPNIISILNEERNGQILTRFSNYFASKMIEVFSPNLSTVEKDNLAPFIGILISEVVSATFKDTVEYFKKIETFISIAQKVYKTYVYITDKLEVSFDDTIIEADFSDSKNYDEFKFKYREILNKHYSISNPMGRISQRGSD